MDKTIKINLAGTLFHIDEVAYRLLRDYLQAIDLKFRQVPGGTETIEDIESRIAEIFQSQKNIGGVISKENVDEMVKIIGKPEEFDHSESETGSTTFTSQKKRMHKNPEDTVISGVCGGIGAYLDTDPVWIRFFFILFTLFFGIGFFVYIALWIALPTAHTEAQKKEMHGKAYYSSITQTQKHGGSGISGTSRVGNALNEIFMAVGRVIYIIVRIFLIIIGIALVITGFLALLTFVMVFLFKYPGAFSTSFDGVNLSYIPDFLNYIIAPAIVPWIKVLITSAVVLPLLAITYWGVKMIFWFKARDGVVSLIGLVLWIMSIAALAIIIFNEGIGYAERASYTSRETLKEMPDILYIRSGKSIAELKYDHEISIPDENYNLYIAEDRKEVFVRTYLTINLSENNTAAIEVRKRSAGRSRSDALLKAEALEYHFSIMNDTLFFDEYFNYSQGNKWAFDNVSVTLLIPEGTVVYMDMDKNAENLINPDNRKSYEMNWENFEENNRFWKMTDKGLKHIETKQK
jgi:phage shock protein PspC (stress-responsive transcriptional regulator)